MVAAGNPDGCTGTIADAVDSAGPAAAETAAIGTPITISIHNEVDSTAAVAAAAFDFQSQQAASSAAPPERDQRTLS